MGMIFGSVVVVRLKCNDTLLDFSNCEGLVVLQYSGIRSELVFSHLSYYATNEND